MKASLSNYRQAPRKVRLVADMIRGKSVSSARDTLTFLPKKAAPEIVKLLNSAVANARTQGFSEDDLVVKTITVDKGAVLRRFTPKARGRAGRIHKEMSIVKLELGSLAALAPKKEKKEKTKEETANTEKPTAKPVRSGKPRAKKVTK